MNILKKLWLGFCWVMIGFFLLGVLGAFIMPFTEPDVSFVDAIITFTFSALFAWIFFIPIKKSKQRKKAEIVEMRERLNAEKKEVRTPTMIYLLSLHIVCFVIRYHQNLNHQKYLLFLLSELYGLFVFYGSLYGSLHGSFYGSFYGSFAL